MQVYLDHNATCPLDERVLEAMLPYLKGGYGNPSSVHAPGCQARAALDEAREQVAGLVHAHPSQVIFTSGGTEANNLALKGYSWRKPAGAVAVSAIEHASVREAATALGRWGWRLDRIAADGQGLVTPDAVHSAMSPDTRLVSVMAANNETGAIQPVEDIAAVVREAGCILHTDAVQAAGKVALDFTGSGAHLMSLSAHKMYGPKGVGALIVDKSLDLEPLLHGGGHEKGRRAGTENVASIVGFGVAAQLALEELEQRRDHVGILRNRLEARLAGLSGVVLFSADAERLANTAFLSVIGIDGETLVMNLDQAGYAISSGSACSSPEPGVSHVLDAMGVPADVARGAIRISLGKDNTQSELDSFADVLGQQIQNLLMMSSGAMARS